MTRSDVASMLTLLRVTYPAFYSKMDRKDMKLVLDLWTEMFQDDDTNIVKYALKQLIATHTGYPPDIAAVKNKVKEVCSAATGEMTDEELWQRLKQAVANGIYGARKEFESLPPVLQRYVGSPAGITELAMVDTDTLNTVSHGQFLKQIGLIKQRQEYSDRLPEAMKNLIQEAYKPLVIEDYNDRRNNLLAELGGE